MADSKISALTAVTTPAATDELAVNQSGTSKKMTLAQSTALAGGAVQYTTAGSIWTWTFSSAPVVADSRWAATPITGFTTSIVTGTELYGLAVQEASTTLVHAASGSLTTAVRHAFNFRLRVRTNLATTLQLRSTQSAGTLTPQAGSYMRAIKLL
jgi:hypothetical protein